MSSVLIPLELHDTLIVCRVPESIHSEPFAPEPEEHTFLDPGITSRVLYLQTDQWFPNTTGVLPGHTNRASRWLKEAVVDIPASINPAEQIRLNKLLAAHDVTVDIEKKRKLEKPLTVTQRLKRMREERAKSAGKKWYHLGRPVLTEELRQELAVLRLQRYAMPGRYKKQGAKAGEEKYFEMGYVVAPATAHYTDRATSSADGSVRKSAKLGFVDALLQDQQYRKYAKRKRQEQLEKQERNAKLSRPSKKPLR